MLSIRKRLQEQGGSLLVVLPKIWTDSKGLKRHDMVELRLNECLIIAAIKDEDEKQQRRGRP